jgi:tetratricopeptide (TPR) repeat protein
LKKNTLFYIVIFIGTAILTFFLTRSGYKTSTSDQESASVHSDGIPEVNENPSVEDTNATDEIGTLLKEAHEAVYDKGIIMQGVLKYKEVLELDSNNVEALYNLGMLSIQSNQLEIAKVRFEKLILLQPENQEFKTRYSEVLEKLGE